MTHWDKIGARRPEPAVSNTSEPTIEQVLEAPRVRWKWRLSNEWQYGRPISYLDKPCYLIENESGRRVVVDVTLKPEPTHERPTVLTPEDMQAMLHWATEAGVELPPWFAAQIRDAR